MMGNNSLNRKIMKKPHTGQGAGMIPSGATTMKH